MAPLHVASLGRQCPLASAPFTPSTVEDHPHVPILVGEYMLDVPVCLWLGARHDEDQVCHDRLRCIADADLLQACDSLKDGRPSDAGRSAQGSGKLSSQKTPRPERRKADSIRDIMTPTRRPANARERDQYSTPERRVVVRSTTAARLGLRRDLVLRH